LAEIGRGGERQKTGKKGEVLKKAFFHLRLVADSPSFAPRNTNNRFFMSKHNSLKSSATVGGKRSVLKRFERVKLMKERGQWKQGRSPLGLPKTKHEA
jgi:small basic protein (TIGR04137 family)